MSLFYKHFLFILVGCFCVGSAPVHAAFTPVGNAKPIHEGFVSRFIDITPQVVVAKAPPAPLTEVIPEKPANDVVWINGYWAWIVEKNEYIWICGIYRRFPPNHFWISGNWIEQQGGWVWARGFWSEVPFEKLVYIKKAPPSAINDNAAQAPGNDYFWAPGYWNYTASTQNYGWLTGKWQQLNPKWILAPATYTWRPDGFVFTPFFWDWKLEDRGYAYMCTGNGPLVVMEPEFICQQIFCCYPDYLVFYCHCWHYYPGWWGGCGCIPQWWYWSSWWSLSWNNSWGIWWWWTHGPGPGPIWMTQQMSQGIAPAPQSLLKVFAMKMPKLNVEFGTEILTATGPENGKELPLPTFTITITPTGPIQLPELPVVVSTDPRTQTESGNQVQIPNSPEDFKPSETNLPYNSDFDNDNIREGGFENQQQIEFPSDDQYPGRPHPYRPHNERDPRRDHPYRPHNEDNQGRDHPQFPGKHEFPRNQGNTPNWNNNSGGSGGSSEGNPGKKGRGQ